ncbi:MAG: LytTR family transcriptional regulator [Clostridia bacterium]|nr:LytTR family transcriptional regulator [Clostridia bacterium]
MRVEIKQTPEAAEPFAVIYCREADETVLAAAEALRKGSDVVTVFANGRIIVIDKRELYMLRAEEGRTRLYTSDAEYDSAKPLRDYESLSGFMRISKFCVINLEKIKCFEPLFSGMMQVELKNGMKDTISRKYLPDIKRYLGL